MSHGSLSTAPITKLFKKPAPPILLSEPFLDSLMGYVWETGLLISRVQTEFNPGQLADSI